MIVYKNMNLSAVVGEHTALVPILDRFGISLGLGEKTVSEICSEKNIDEDFFLTVVNTFLNEEYFPEKQFKSFCEEQIVSYMRSTNAYYMQYQLPNIDAHLGRLIATSSSENSQLPMIGKMVVDLKKSMEHTIENDEKTLFPSCLNGTKNSSVCCEDDNSCALLDDIKSIIIKHISGDYNKNLCYAVLFSISALQKDLNHHQRIRNRVLIPMIRQ
ncbi:MAG: hypothetical protein PHD21_02280 [Flavobacteriales bacterium]|nr:hypothetical protein [Flavobacteriales bacterium]